MPFTSVRDVVRVAKSINAYAREAIEVEKISAVSGKVGLTMGVMSITAGPTTWQIYRLPKKAVMHFTNKVEEAIRGRRLGSEG